MQETLKLSKKKCFNFSWRVSPETWDAICFKKRCAGKTTECSKHLWQIATEEGLFSELNRCIFQITGTAHGREVAKKVSLSKICYTFPILMKLGTVIPYLRKIQKLHISRDKPIDLCWDQHFFTENVRKGLKLNVKKFQWKIW